MEKGRWRQDPLLGENSRKGNLRTLGTGLPRESAMKKFTVRDRSRPERHACFRGGLTIGVHKIPFLEFSPVAHRIPPRAPPQIRTRPFRASGSSDLRFCGPLLSATVVFT